MDRSADILMDMIRYAVFDPDASSMTSEPISDAMLTELYMLAKRHSMTGLVGHALEARNLLKDSPVCALFRKAMFNEIYYYEKLNFTYELLCEELERAQIDFLPLKGAVLRQYYPQPWMRTSCDIDILVHKKDISRAEAVLTSALGFEKSGTTTHDISFYSTDAIHVELHYDLVERRRAGKARQVLARIWEHAAPVQDGSYRHKLDDAMFYFYHIAHMAKHFELAGCGIRMFLDLCLLMEPMQNSRSQIDVLLEKSGLLTFDKEACELCKVWFLGQKPTDNSSKLTKFILDSGTFGTRENLYITGKRRHGGTAGYLLSRVFIPYKLLKNQYPILEKWPILAPICAVHRVYLLLFGRKRTRLQEYFRATNSDAATNAENIADVLDIVGL